MSRLIDADALEKDGWMMHRTVQVDKHTMSYQTKKPTDFPTIEPKYNLDDKRKIADLHKMVNYLLSQLEQQWIPCSERLPEENSDILVTYVEKDEKRIVPVNYGCGTYFDCFFNKELNQTGVLAWTPLPEPYREDEAE